MAELVKVTINDQEFEIEAGTPLIDACNENDFGVPFVLLLQRPRAAGFVPDVSCSSRKDAETSGIVFASRS